MPESKAFVIRLDPGLKRRIVTQCERLNITQSSFVKMAIVRFVEEEEKNQAFALQR